MRTYPVLVAFLILAGCAGQRGPVVSTDVPTAAAKTPEAITTPAGPADDDDDKIVNRDDQCPRQAEDFDGFEDEDGCPDVDNDGDGVLDVDDRCPMQAELINGYEDGDGCHNDPPRVVVSIPHHPPRTDLFFDRGSSKLKARYAVTIDEVANVLRDNPDVLLVEIEGHADDPGGARANLKLSTKRAESVHAAIVHRGIDPKRLVVKGYGKERPLARTEGLKGKALEEAREKNRRVQFKILDRK